MDDAGHVPVLVAEAMDLLRPAGRKVLVDCTVGLGGHAEALLSLADAEALLIGIDVDESNLRRTKARLARFSGRFRLFQANFADLKLVLAEAGVQRVDALLADLGVSSTQLDEPGRGFSFQVDGPLDMRMGSEGQTAADLVKYLSEKQLADIIWRYGEERHSRRISRAIVDTRHSVPITSTVQLADIVTRAAPPARWGEIHPATRTFQALRIAVNHELDSLEKLLGMLPDVLTVGSRAAVISFHSLEDRLVKQAFNAAAQSERFLVLTRKPVTASDDETRRNPRSRSAKLRALERTA
jgi:16S rRNA (cytosine1402-N4)-methyltransferase